MRRAPRSSLIGRLLAAVVFFLPRPAVAEAVSVSLQRIDLSALPDIRLYFSVGDLQGNSILGLTERELALLCDGAPQKVVSLHSALQGGESLSVALLFDRSGSMMSALDRTKDAAVDFIRRLSRDDEVAVVSFDHTIRVEAPLAPDKAAGEKAVRAIPLGLNTSLFDAIEVALGLLKNRSTKRQAVVILSDGIDTRSRRTKEEVLAQAKSQGVPLYTIGQGAKLRRDVLGVLASESGGLFFEADGPEDLLALYQKIGERLQNQYVLVFRPAFGVDEKWHTLEIRYAPSTSPPASTSREFIASSGPGVSASTLDQLERRLRERERIVWAGGGAAAGLLLGLLLMALLKTLRSDLRLGFGAWLGVIFLASVLGGLVGVILKSFP
ncbi:MAG: VWA domain-containing protein [Candidatus Aminicenantes bacterium]|nr:VWA domain-containing protein [Candidatus Aminicenantes bacterium]